MGRKRHDGDKQIEMIRLITVIVALVTSIVSLASKLIEWLMGR